MESLTVPGRLESLEPIGKFVMAAAAEAGLEKAAAYRLRLAVDEIATNIILYGYDSDRREGSVELHATLDDEALTIAVEDTAAPFDPRQKAPPADLNAALEDRQIGGLGVFLALEGVDQFDYEWADNRNRNIFAMRRRPVAAPK
jgi:anti-sigma regulatory factor (Ser/Thr protein kinase)